MIFSLFSMIPTTIKYAVSNMRIYRVNFKHPQFILRLKRYAFIKNSEE